MEPPGSTPTEATVLSPPPSSSRTWPGTPDTGPVWAAEDFPGARGPTGHNLGWTSSLLREVDTYLHHGHLMGQPCHRLLAIAKQQFGLPGQHKVRRRATGGCRSPGLAWPWPEPVAVWSAGEGSGLQPHMPQLLWKQEGAARATLPPAGRLRAPSFCMAWIHTCAETMMVNAQEPTGKGPYPQAPFSPLLAIQAGMMSPATPLTQCRAEAASGFSPPQFPSPHTCSRQLRHVSWMSCSVSTSSPTFSRTFPAAFWKN